MAGFDVDRLCPIFLSSIGRTFLFNRQTQQFSSAFVNKKSSNVSEKIVFRKSLAPKAGARKAGSANIDADETPRPPSQRAEPAEYSKWEQEVSATDVLGVAEASLNSLGGKLSSKRLFEGWAERYIIRLQHKLSGDLVLYTS